MFYPLIGKQCIARLDAASAAFDQGLYCLLTEYSIKILIKLKNTTQHPLKLK